VQFSKLGPIGDAAAHAQPMSRVERFEKRARPVVAAVGLVLLTPLLNASRY